MRTLFSLLTVFVLAVGMVHGQTGCLQDQYGNQYNFTVDKTNTYLYGTATSTQCPGAAWDIIGSFVTTPNGIGLEITAANPNPPNGCAPVYTLKGMMPNFQWFYEDGVSNPPQPGTWVACGTKTSDPGTGKGALKH